MSLINRNHRLSVKRFAAVPPLLNLPPIQRGDASVSALSSQSMRAGVNLEEGCIITHYVKYTHQLAHMINAVRSHDPEPFETLIEFVLKVIPYTGFSLNHPCNLVYLEAFLHTSLDLYAFIALVPSMSTVKGLIKMVKSDNDRRQREMDRKGLEPGRSLNFLDTSFSDPEYELICLHPEHFLPRGAILPIYSITTGTWKTYVASRDRRLRESVESDSDRLPPFRHFHNRNEGMELNVFLVTLNAEIKIRRYFKIIPQDTHVTALPDDVLALMHCVLELVNLLYWDPVPTKGSQGETIQAQLTTLNRRNPGRAGRSQPQYNEMTSGEESGEGGPPTPSKASKSFRQLVGLSLEERKAYGTALMSGHDIDYDPALFENAYPIDDTPPLYSNTTTMEAWSRGVTSEGTG